MNGKTLLVTRSCKISVALRQLTLRDTESQEQKQVPIEDLEMLVVEHRHVSISLPALAELAQANVAVVVCADNYMPVALCLPMEGQTLQARVQRAQFGQQHLQAPKLWAQVVRSKIANQAAVLAIEGQNALALERLASKVRPENAQKSEATAARKYFSPLFGEDFSRNPDGLFPNDMLNYGYAIVRACMARNLVGAGLFVGYGLQHDNQYNAFPLADDMMEPYRPMVDWWVRRRIRLGEGDSLMNTTTKQYLVSLLFMPVVLAGRQYQMHDAMGRTATSLAHCLHKMQDDLLLPTAVLRPDG